MELTGTLIKYLITLFVMTVLLSSIVVVVPCYAYTVHENPDSPAIKYGFTIDTYIQQLFQELVISGYDLSLAVNSSDFNKSVLSYGKFNFYSRNYISLLKYYNLSDSDYWALSTSLSNSAIDFGTIVNESYIYDTNYKLYENCTAQGDTTTATLYAIELQRSYQNLSHSIRNVKSNLSVAVALSNNTYVKLDESTLNDINLTLDQFNQYQSRIIQNEKEIEELLGGNNLSLSSSARETAIKEPITLTSYLVDKDNAPVGNAKIELYANDGLADTGVTDSNGTSIFQYGVPLDSKNKITFYTRYVPKAADRLSATSNEVDLWVIPERTTLSMDVERTTATFGDMVIASGTLKSDSGMGVPDRRIDMYVNGNLAGYTVTGSNGYYRYYLSITPNTPGGLCDIQTVYRASSLGDDIFLGSSANISTIDVTTQNTVLAMNSPGSELTAGEEAWFSGSLFAENGLPVQRSAVSIYAGDELFGTAVTENNGEYMTNISVPFGMASGTYPIVAHYSPGSGKALNGSSSNVINVYINSSPLVITAASPPAILFAGDVLSINGSVSTIYGQPVSNQSLYINMSNTSVAEIVTDANGSYTFFRPIGYNDLMGFYGLTVVLPGSGLMAEAATPAGQVLIIPYDKVLVAIVVVILLAIIAVVLLQVTGVFRRVLTRQKRPVAAPDLAEKIVKKEMAEEKPATPPVPEPKKEFSLGESLKVTQGYIDSGNLKGAIAHIYMVSRHIAATQGLQVSDSTTHREFCSQFASRYPALSTSLQAIVKTYEKANFSTDNISELEVTDAINCLKEVHLLLTVKNTKETVV